MDNSVWKLLLYLTISVLLSSCSMPKNLVSESDTLGKHSPLQLHQITISSFWQKKFTGILAISITDNNIHYALLDAMGIKLLEADVSGIDRYEVTGGVKKLMKSNLPAVMAESLIRIYRLEPVEQPCSTSFWNTLCQKKLDDGSRIKYCRSGLFVRWKVRFLSNADTIVYSRSLIGFTLELTPVQSTKTHG